MGSRRITPASPLIYPPSLNAHARLYNVNAETYGSQMNYSGIREYAQINYLETELPNHSKSLIRQLSRFVQFKTKLIGH